MSSDYDQLIADDVREHGLSIITIADATVPFAYTVGQVFAEQHPGPEMILFGLAPELAGQVLRGMATLARAGQPFAPGTRYNQILESAPVATRRVDPTQHPLYLGFAMGHCASRGHIGELEALQVFWPDPQGRFPFDRGCEERVWSLQPRLDQPLTRDEVRLWERDVGIES